MNKKKRQRTSVAEMRILRWMCEVFREKKIRYSHIRGVALVVRKTMRWCSEICYENECRR